MSGQNDENTERRDGPFILTNHWFADQFVNCQGIFKSDVDCCGKVVLGWCIRQAIYFRRFSQHSFLIFHFYRCIDSISFYTPLWRKETLCEMSVLSGLKLRLRALMSGNKSVVLDKAQRKKLLTGFISSICWELSSLNRLATCWFCTALTMGLGRQWGWRSGYSIPRCHSFDCKLLSSQT